MGLSREVRLAMLVGVTSSAIGACGGRDPVLPQQVDGSQTAVTATVGRELGIMVGTVGPGAYDSIPAISSGVIRFLDAAIVPPYVPAGPRQRFRFMPEQRGTAVITLTHSGTTPTVTIAVSVR